jgi:hypothetical protein
VPVYNVCLPLLRELEPDRPPLRVIELAAPAPAPTAPEPGGATPSSTLSSQAE